MAYSTNYIAKTAKVCYTYSMSTILDKIKYSHVRQESPLSSTFSTHFHNYYELYLFLSGDVEYIVGDTTYNLKPYDLLLIKPTVYHYPKIQSSTPYERFYINFPYDSVDDGLKDVLDGTRVRFSYSEDAFVKNIFTTFSDISNLNESDAHVFCKQAINMLLLKIKHADPENEDAQKIHPTLSKMLRYIDDNLSEELDVESISSRFFVSPSWVFHSFKEQFHISYKKYVNHKKLLYSQQLIQKGVSAYEASISCGFSEYTTFYRQYVKQFGIAPSKEKRI